MTGLSKINLKCELELLCNHSVSKGFEISGAFPVSREVLYSPVPNVLGEGQFLGYVHFGISSRQGKLSPCLHHQFSGSLVTVLVTAQIILRDECTLVSADSGETLVLLTLFIAGYRFGDGPNNPS
jgi:hypothetical protein